MAYSIGANGSIQRYKYEDINLDNINTRRILLTLSQQPVLDQEKYRKAAYRLHEQLAA